MHSQWHLTEAGRASGDVTGGPDGSELPNVEVPQ